MSFSLNKERDNSIKYEIMKKVLQNFYKTTLLIAVSLFAVVNTGKAQITMSTANCTISANEVQMDILITNNSAADLRWNSTVLRMTVPAAMIPAGAQTYTVQYIGGSDFPLSWPAVFPAPAAGASYTAASRLLTFTTGTAGAYNNLTCTAPLIAPGQTKTIGRFSFTITSSNFVAGADATFTWQTTSSCNLYQVCAGAVTGYNQASGLRTLAPPCNLTVPASCSSPTVNSNPADQSVCTSGNATYTASFNGGSPVPALTWQVQTGGVGIFTDLTEAAPYSGVNSNTLNITNPSVSLSTNRYRLKANNTCGDVFTNSALLTVNPDVSAGTVSGTSPLCIGATASYSSNGTAGGIWSSTNTLVASVDGAGLVTALTSGTTDITYTVTAGCGSPVSSFSILTVSPNVTAGTVSGTSPLCGGLTTVYTSNGTAGGTWSSTNPAIASVNPATGLVTALTAGTTDITYTVNAGCGSPVSSFLTLTVTGNAGLAGTPGGPMVCSVATIQPGGSTFADGSCKSIASIVPSGLVPVTGDINVCVTVDDQVYTYQTRPYVQRHYDITPVTNAENATATITLYFTQGEFDAYNLARGLNPALPADALDAANNKANLRVTQFHGTGTYPGNYTGPANPDLINPDDNNIVWNATLNRWEVTFNVNGFSGFYIFTSLINTPLPVNLLSFSGRNNGNVNLLDWSTSSEQNSSYFDIERSTDGTRFMKAGRVSAAGNSSVTRQYNFNDDISSVNTGLYYYRLKQVDLSGQEKYSPVVIIKQNSKGFNAAASPNPFTDHLRIQVESDKKENAVIMLTQLDGKRIRIQNASINKGSNVIWLDELDNLPGGVYLLHINTGSEKRTLKVIRQN